MGADQWDMVLVLSAPLPSTSQDIKKSGRVATWNKRGGDLGAARQESADEPLGAAQLKSDVAVLGG